MMQAQRFQNTLMIAPQASTGAGTVTAEIDTASLGGLTNSKVLSMEVDVLLGARVDSSAAVCTVSLLESDDTVVSNFATITADINPILTAAGVIAYYIDMKPRKRWIRVTVTDGATTHDIVKFAVLAKTRAGQEPASTTDLATTAVII